MPYDYGFDLPDQRDSYYDTSGELVTIQIVRHWHCRDHYNAYYPDYDCSFDISRGQVRTSLPIGCDQAKAEQIARVLYAEDAEATRQHHADLAIQLAELRTGA